MLTLERMQTMLAVLVLTPILSMIGINALDNGLALTPPMGFLTWERFRCQTDCKKYPDSCINERLYMNMADVMVRDGYKVAGYEYVIIDDCWLAKERDENGRLQPDPDRFPSGIKKLADYIHSRGLKFGIYENYGEKTCAGYPGSLGHLELDANTFAEWEVDYLKLDGCNTDLDEMTTGYPEMGRYLNLTGRPIVYSCSWPAYWVFKGRDPDYEAIAKSCNLWRMYNDIEDDWTSVTSIVDFIASVSDNIAPHVGPGAWNDPDQLVIGDFGLSLDQSKSQMALWTIMASPLLISADLRHITDEQKAILLNKDIIKMNQDPKGFLGRRILKRDAIEVWGVPLVPETTSGEPSWGLAIWNRINGGGPSILQFKLSDLELHNELGYSFKELFDGISYGVLKPDDTLTVTVNPVGAALFKATVISPNRFCGNLNV